MKCYLFALALAAAALTSACGDDNGPNGGGSLRLVNVSPDAGPIDIVLDGDTIVRNLAYRGASDYLDAPEGGHTLQVSTTGTTNTLLDQDVSIADGTIYSVLVADTVASLKLIVLTDDNGAPPAGKVKVRAVHAAPHAGHVDVYVTTPEDVITGATPALINVQFGQFSTYLDADEGSYRVRVTPTESTDVLIDSGELALSAGQVRTVIAVDPENGEGPFDILVLSDRD